MKLVLVFHKGSFQKKAFVSHQSKDNTTSTDKSFQKVNAMILSVCMRVFCFFPLFAFHSDRCYHLIKLTHYVFLTQFQNTPIKVILRSWHYISWVLFESSDWDVWNIAQLVGTESWPEAVLHKYDELHKLSSYFANVNVSGNPTIQNTASSDLLVSETPLSIALCVQKPGSPLHLDVGG